MSGPCCRPSRASRTAASWISCRVGTVMISTRKASPKRWTRLIQWSSERSRQRCSRAWDQARTRRARSWGVTSSGRRRVFTWCPIQNTSRTWRVFLWSRVRNRVQHRVPELLVVDNEMCWNHWQLRRQQCFRRGTSIALYLGPDRFDMQFATKELAQDMQMPSKLSMMRLRRVVRYLLGTADVGPFFAYQSEPKHSAGLDWWWLEWQCGNLQVDICRCNPAGQSHDWDVERESAGEVTQLGREWILRDLVRMCAWFHRQSRAASDSPRHDARRGHQMTVCTDSDAARGMIHRVGCGLSETSADALLVASTSNAWRTFHRVTLQHEGEPERSRHEDLGEGGNDKLHEQACNRPYVCFEKCHRSGSHVGEQCQQSGKSLPPRWTTWCRTMRVPMGKMKKIELPPCSRLVSWQEELLLR